jgi:predicted phosphoribosyltransferase
MREPEYFGAVGSWYDHFEQTEDDEVKALLAEADMHLREKRRI